MSETDYQVDLLSKVIQYKVYNTLIFFKAEFFTPEGFITLIIGKVRQIIINTINNSLKHPPLGYDIVKFVQSVK